MDEQDTQAAAELISGPLYKYRSLSGPPEGQDEDPDNPSPRECTRRLIVKGEVYHTPKSKLNDPFEMRFQIDLTGTDQQKCDKMIDVFMGQGKSYQDAANDAISLFNRPEGLDQYLRDNLEVAYDTFPSQYGVFSASLRWPAPDLCTSCYESRG